MASAIASFHDLKIFIMVYIYCGIHLHYELTDMYSLSCGISFHYASVRFMFY